MKNTTKMVLAGLGAYLLVKGVPKLGMAGLSDPYSPYYSAAGYGGGAQQCVSAGGLWDSFSGQCSSAIQQQNPYASDPYFGMQPAYNSYPTQMTTDQWLQQGINSGLIYVVRQARGTCPSNRSQYCNSTFSDNATRRSRMNYKTALAYVMRMQPQAQAQSPYYYGQQVQTTQPYYYGQQTQQTYGGSSPVSNFIPSVSDVPASGGDDIDWAL